MTIAFRSLIKEFRAAAFCVFIFLLLAQGLTASAGYAADQPIDINADQLELQQDRNLAIFRGNVIAKQGDIKLRAEQLRVWYMPSSEKRTKNNNMADGTIVRIDAIDQVFVSSPTESAKGDLGVYDVAEQRLTLTGTVILTRGKNVLRGKKLVMNMRTGQSQMSGGRVHGRFIPPKQKKRTK